ncbi:hypothetical protein A2U01_0008267, partial [Trifolium medium]|nr:hypothetical protein [Trifolium medium]
LRKLENSWEHTIGCAKHRAGMREAQGRSARGAIQARMELGSCQLRHAQVRSVPRGSARGA